MPKFFSILRFLYQRFGCTILYILLIVLINSLFLYLPFFTIRGSEFSSADFTVGIIYVMRDFAQREIKHYVIIAMLIGSFFSYIFASKAVAVASVSSFLIAEFVDWGIYTFTKKPLSQRILWSASISSPIDSVVFLYLMNMLNAAGAIVMTAVKIGGVIAVWYYWRKRQERKTAPFSLIG